MNKCVNVNKFLCLLIRRAEALDHLLRQNDSEVVMVLQRYSGYRSVRGGGRVTILRSRVSSIFRQLGYENNFSVGLMLCSLT